MLTWIYELRPGNQTIYVVFDEESDLSGPRPQFLSLDQVLFRKNVPMKESENIIYIYIYIQWGF